MTQATINYLLSQIKLAEIKLRPEHVDLMPVDVRLTISEIKAILALIEQEK